MLARNPESLGIINPGQRGKSTWKKFYKDLLQKSIFWVSEFFFFYGQTFPKSCFFTIYLVIFLTVFFFLYLGCEIVPKRFYFLVCDGGPLFSVSMIYYCKQSNVRWWQRIVRTYTLISLSGAKQQSNVFVWNLNVLKAKVKNFDQSYF